MKKILITGIDSYIGTNFETFLNNNYHNYFIETLDVKTQKWKNFDFSTYDVIFHVAAIVHKKENTKSKKLYDDVNYRLPLEIASHAKKSNIKLFIFMSSMSVYGMTVGCIDKNTFEKPRTLYGISKLKAEKELLKIEDNNFKVAILRAPLVYGRNSRGNFTKLINIFDKLSIFPNYMNKRSMIYIDNLCMYVKEIIDNGLNGIFFPQNSDYVSTSEIFKTYKRLKNTKYYLFSLINFSIKFMLFIRVKLIEKLFGNLVYDMSLNNNKIKIKYCSFEDTIKNSIDLDK